MPDRYAVIGNPVTHSKSPIIHAEFARQTGQDIVYVRLPAPKRGFRAELNRFIAHGGRGLNVTVPFKQEAAAACQSVSERGKFAEAVNTLTFADGKIVGDNTDGAGLLRDLEKNLHVDLRGRRVLLLGAGGAARGVMMPLIARGVRTIVVANRDVGKARLLEERFGLFGNVLARGYDELAQTAFELIINATSASLQGSIPPVPRSVFTPDCVAYDMVYAAGGRTPFLDMARDCGAIVTSDGLGMLVEQAAESFFIWRGVRPQTRPVLEMLRAAGMPAH
ncbi:MAG: shikimate dehydrogenase [Betaproteobacteria bacterium]|nr:MAG: shikimate dehydrogenase [Betaproteobacteria bacterium]